MAFRFGNNRNNTINGTNRGDFIASFGGNDVINAGRGSDLIFAGSGNDTVNAGRGNDFVDGGSGNDIINAGGGNDLVFGGSGNDTVNGGAGRDSIYGGTGDDILDGGRGRDIVDGGSGNDTLLFNAADQSGFDDYRGGSGNDTLVIDFTGDRWADLDLQAEIIALLEQLQSGNTSSTFLSALNLNVQGVENLVVRVDGVVIDPTDTGTGGDVPVAEDDAYVVGENGSLGFGDALPFVTGNDTIASQDYSVELVTGPEAGILTLDASGVFSYDPGTAFDYLAVGETASVEFTYAVTDENGTSAPATVTITVEGANDAAIITGDITGSVVEDGEMATANGTVSVADADNGQNGIGNPGSYQGLYGNLVLAPDGSWTYDLDNTLAATQALTGNDIETEQFEVISLDETASQTITITVSGSNDAATLGGEFSGTVSEDDSITAQGVLTITDADTGEALIGNPGLIVGTYGSLTLSENGSWTYELANDSDAVQSLGEGVTVTDIFTVTSLDGTASENLTITVSGTNDAASASGDFGQGTGDLSTPLFEDSAPVSQSGSITVSDIDTGEAFVDPQEFAEGAYGSFTIDANGNWTYTLTPGDTLDALNEGDLVTDSFEVFSADGTSLGMVSVDIVGENDEPVITGDTEGTFFFPFPGQEVVGQFFVNDADEGESFAESSTFEGLNGNLFVGVEGNWSYVYDGGIDIDTDIELPIDGPIDGPFDGPGPVILPFPESGVLDEFTLNTADGTTFMIVIENDFAIAQ